MVPPLAGPIPAQSDLHRGMNVAHLHNRLTGYGTAPATAQLRRLRDLGVSHVALTPFGYVRRVTDVAIRFGGDLDPSLSDEALLAEAQHARALGLRVTLKPHIWSRAFWTQGQSRQDIHPDPAAGGWEAWFDAYTAFALHYARLAERMQASLYVVGLEYLQATRHNPGAWADVATACRGAFGGPLTYAANWWSEAEAFADWRAFDVMAVNAYYPLAVDGPPTADALAAAWAPALGRLGGLARDAGRDVLFAEAGVPAVAGAHAEPWNSGQRGEAAPALQAAYYEALLRAAVPQPWFRGVYWWKWFTDDRTRERDPYCPMGQPAEAVLSRWWATGT